MVEVNFEPDHMTCHMADHVTNHVTEYKRTRCWQLAGPLAGLAKGQADSPDQLLGNLANSFS